MSSSEEWEWERPRRRQELYRERVAKTTESFLDRFAGVIDDMLAEGLDQYVRTDFDSAERMLSEARAELDGDVERARELSRSLGNLLHGLPRFARELRNGERNRLRNEERDRRAAEERVRAANEQARLDRARREARAEREREEAERARHVAEERARVENERAKERLVSRLHDIAAGIINDPVANDLAYDRIKREIEKTSQQAAESSTTAETLESEFRSRCEELKSTAMCEAEVWRQEHRRIAAQESVQEEVDLQLQAIDAERQGKSEKALAELNSLTAQLMAVKTQLQSETANVESATQELETARSKADDIHCSEELRRDTLRAINRQMTELGFFGRTPVVQGQWVRLVYSRLDGSQAQFLVDTEGAMKFKFDGYRGKACKKDRDAVMEKMRSAYGVEFSKQRIIWENPDEVGKDAIDARKPDSYNGGF